MYKYTKTELLQGLMRDSRSAFEEVCRRYTRSLYVYCFDYTRNSAYTEEIVQDILIALWNYRGKLKESSSLDAIIFTIARHHAVNAFRKTINAPVYEDYVEYNEKLAVTDCDHLEYEEFLGRIENALKLLPASQRRVVELSKLHNLTNKEIADQLGISEKTVRNQLSLGLTNLKKHLTLSGIVLFIVNLIAS